MSPKEGAPGESDPMARDNKATTCHLACANILSLGNFLRRRHFAFLSEYSLVDLKIAILSASPTPEKKITDDVKSTFV